MICYCGHDLGDVTENTGSLMGKRGNKTMTNTKKPEELLQEFRIKREQMTPRERVEAYREFNAAMKASLESEPKFVSKRNRIR